MDSESQSKNDSRYVYLFGEVEAVEEKVGGDWEEVRALLGGKGANLAEMTRLGIPVCPGFTVTTEACNAYLSATGRFPGSLWDQELAAMKEIEKATGKFFGDLDNPLLVSCRSGAKFSMPGMMDTVLNIGLNDEVVQKWVERSGEARFVYDSYRRLVQMFGSVVLGVDDEPFEAVITEQRNSAGVASDSQLSAEDWMKATEKFKQIVKDHTGEAFPADPYEQLKLATEAVFKSWDGKRAIDYRNAARIPHDLGTAVNIQTMVFGNMGDDCATGVAMSRNASTGEPELEGDFLINAQGEDVVAGTRQTQPIEELKEHMPEVYDAFEKISQRLEKHYRNMQDMEFTVETGQLWLLQTRDGKRTAQAEVRIAVDMFEERLISKEEAVRRVRPDQVDFFLHPQLDASERKKSQLIATGLNVSPGAAVGQVAFDADTAEAWAREDGKKVIMVRPETKPDDVHGMLASQGILTSRGGRASHAALVARQFGKPAVVGVSKMEIDLEKRQMTIGETVIREDDWISLDGSSGEVLLGELPTVVPEFDNPYLLKVLKWADEIRRLEVWANADSPQDATRARSYGAQGIGLCRTEHMFFGSERLPIVQNMIMSKSEEDQKNSIDQLLPLQRDDFHGLFKAMDGLPVVIRLLDPPLHEFLPAYGELMRELADLHVKAALAENPEEEKEIDGQIQVKNDILKRVESLHESNPMLGTRGVRLGILIPALTKMQVRAIFEAACLASREGFTPIPEVMIPLTCHVNELKLQQEELQQVARQVMDAEGIEIKYKFGTMIEIPRAALTADEFAEVAEFFSFGTNDLTQTVFGISRDDAEAGFLVHYLENNILPENPFASLDPTGVGRLMEMAVEYGRRTNPDLEIGICGEHGGDPSSIAICHRLGFNYVSCSPFRVPIARLAAAHAALDGK
ncbi:MAG: pyruvate, phosphate dikinase [Acidobacteriota bacterium]|nr:pyruvate, phosphate dikinase [Acidobacteriota bacterium]